MAVLFFLCFFCCKKPFSAGKKTSLSRNVEICTRFHVENISKIYERFQLHDIVSPWQSIQTQQSKPRKGRNVICIEEDVWTFVVKDMPLSTYELFRYSGLFTNMGQVCTHLFRGTNSTFRLRRVFFPAEKGFLLQKQHATTTKPSTKHNHSYFLLYVVRVQHSPVCLNLNMDE